MALPELLQPAGTPCFLLAGHANAPDPLHDDFAVRQGHGRKRKVQTAAPRYVEVSIDMSPEEAAIYDDWYENALGVGNALFTAPIAPLGEGTRYWTAQWVGPPLWTPRAAAHGLRWRLSGTLLLTGEGSDTLPLGATLATEYVIALTGSAAITSGVTLATEYVIALIGELPLTTEYLVELISTETDVRITTVGDTRVTTGGDRRVTTPH